MNTAKFVDMTDATFVAILQQWNLSIMSLKGIQMAQTSLGKQGTFFLLERIW
jgi:hypothetical protein